MRDLARRFRPHLPQHQAAFLMLLSLRKLRRDDLCDFSVL